MKQQVRDKYIPLVAIVSPLLCFILQKNSEAWFNGYQFSYELLIFNALFTFIGLCILIKKDKRTFNLIHHHHECKTPLLFSMLATALIPQTGGAQEFPTETRREIGKFLDATARKEISVGHITVDSVAINGNTLQLFANMNCSYIPFREDNVAEIYKGISALLPTEFAKYRLQLRTNRHSIEELIPQALRSKKTKGSYIQPGCRKASGNQSFQTLYSNQRTAKPSYCLMAKPRFYYEPKLNRWEWQRARCLQTVEDLYTQSFVLPYLVPMLENAGANVLLPRERDCQTAEIIIDNDGCLNTGSTYAERTADKVWQQGTGKGFAHLRPQYIDFENPLKKVHSVSQKPSKRKRKHGRMDSRNTSKRTICSLCLLSDCSKQQ